MRCRATIDSETDREVFSLRPQVLEVRRGNFESRAERLPREFTT